VQVVTGLWDSWSDDAVLDDRAWGEYARPGSIPALNHKSPPYQVIGPLNVPRCPQGPPQFVQAGSSDTGHRFGARHAKSVFISEMEPATARDFSGDLKRIGVSQGRNPEHVLILPTMRDVFVAEVVRPLSKRRLFCCGYATNTLRAHYGLPRPDLLF
jgi:alkanesulfonate monooxygenase SsuD/methylene tetrahydromethanopterin reductase-like flavin-dependent oxidoreductase (luciferase family)